jgi:hypothetical protein
MPYRDPAREQPGCGIPQAEGRGRGGYARVFDSHTFFRSAFFTRRGGEHILDFSQTPNREPNDMNHTESQFVLQTGDDLEIRVREPNGCGFELVLPSHCFFLQPR